LRTATEEIGDVCLFGDCGGGWGRGALGWGGGGGGGPR
jgi:hypothetical protein